MKHASSILSLLILVGVAYISWATPKRDVEAFSGRVIWVSDGDTFKVSGHNWPIRVWGLDAPERDTSKGEASRAFVTDLVKGKTVTCEKVVIDKYKRTVAKCFLGEDDIASMVLDAGFAQEYCSFTRGYYGHC